MSEKDQNVQSGETAAQSAVKKPVENATGKSASAAGGAPRPEPLSRKERAWMLLAFLPAAVAFLFYLALITFLKGFEVIRPVILLFVILLAASGILLALKYWWGFIPGEIAGIWMAYLGLPGGQLRVPLIIAGVVLCIFYFVYSQKLYQDWQLKRMSRKHQKRK